MSTQMNAPPGGPFKSRRGWIIGFGILELLIGCLSVLMGVLVFIALMLLNQAPRPTGTPEMQTAGAIVGLIFYAGLGAIFLVIGIGSLRFKNWARIAAQVVSGCWLVTGLISLVFIVVLLPKVLQQQARTLPPNQLRIMYTMMGILIFGLGILLPAILLAFNSLPSVRTTFLFRNTEQAASPGQATRAAHTPMSVVLLGAWECLGVLSVLSMRVIPATVLFGFVVRGPAAILVVSAFSFISGIAAWLIFRGDSLGWWVSLGKTIFFGASWVLTLLTRDLMDIYGRMGVSEDQLQLLGAANTKSLVTVFSCIGFSIPAILLFMSKRHFPDKDLTAS